MQAQIHAPRVGYAYNLLDNSDFRNPVNQRGATTVSAGGYFIDRWAVKQSGMSASLGQSGMTISNSRSDNTAGYIEQVLPDNVVNSTTHAGKAYTIAAKANGKIDCATATIPNSATINVDSVNQIMLLYSQSAAKWVARCIVNQSGHQMTIEWMALYEGSYTADTLPPYQPKGYAAELAECKRYYELLDSGTSQFVRAYKDDAIAFCIDYYEKRAVPVISMTGALGNALNVAGVGAVTPTSIESAAPIGRKSARVNAMGSFDTSETYAISYGIVRLSISADL